VDATVVTVPAFQGVDDDTARAVADLAATADCALAAGDVPAQSLECLPGTLPTYATPDATLPGATPPGDRIGLDALPGVLADRRREHGTASEHSPEPIERDGASTIADRPDGSTTDD